LLISFCPHPGWAARLQALSEAILTLEADESVQAAILQSSNPSVFSAGLDLAELNDPDSDGLIQFWTSFQQLYLDLYGSRLACVAAIEGHAPAAGCMLALSCDYRIMTDVPEAKIGLNESRVGIVAPPWLGQQMIDTVGRRHAELSLALGTMYGPQEALAIQLVDTVVPSDDVRTKALGIATQYTQIPAAARVAGKRLIRQDRLDTLLKTRKDDLDHFVNFVTHPNTQKNLASYLEAMLAKKDGKKATEKKQNETRKIPR